MLWRAKGHRQLVSPRGQPPDSTKTVHPELQENRHRYQVARLAEQETPKFKCEKEVYGAGSGMSCKVEMEVLCIYRDGAGCYTLLHVAQRGCGVPNLENFQNLSAEDPKQPDWTSKLALPWAGSWSWWPPEVLTVTQWLYILHKIWSCTGQPRPLCSRHRTSEFLLPLQKGYVHF